MTLQYFELHRGTYTSQAHTKRSNRYSEIMLRDIEYFATLASIHVKDYKYPKKDIDDMWENVLLCQFHDVLPGSSIEMVYEDASAVVPLVEYPNVRFIPRYLVKGSNCSARH